MTRATLFAGFLESAARHPESIALRVGTTDVSYATLHSRATTLAAAVRAVNDSGRTVIIAGGVRHCVRGDPRRTPRRYDVRPDRP